MRSILLLFSLVLSACGCSGSSASQPPPVRCPAPPLPSIPLCTPSGWCAVLGPVPTPDPLTVIDGSGPDDVWVAAGHSVWHWDGARWVTTLLDITDPPSDLGTVLALRVFAPDDVWIGLKGLGLQHWDGRGFYDGGLGPRSTVDDLAGTRDDLWAAVDGSLFHLHDELDWSEEPPPVGVTIQGLWAPAPDDVWAVGGPHGANPGSVLHFDGRKWTEPDSGSAGPFVGAWGSGHDDVWVYGQGLLHWDGQQLVAWPEQWTVTAMWGRAADDVWAVRDDLVEEAVLMHFDGTTWSDVPLAPSPGSRGAVLRSGLWGTGDELWVVGGGGFTRTGPVNPAIHRADASGWRDLSPRTWEPDLIGTVISDTDGVHAFAEIGGRLDGDARGWTGPGSVDEPDHVATVGPGEWWECFDGTVSHWRKGSRGAVYAFDGRCTALWADAEGAWVGTSTRGLFVASDSEIRPVPFPLTEIRSITGDSLAHLLVVGDVPGHDTQLLRRTPAGGPLGGSSWESLPGLALVTTALSFGGNETWAATPDGIFTLHLDGAWAKESSEVGPRPTLLGGNAADHLWAAGDGLWSYNGLHWSSAAVELQGASAVATCGGEPAWVVSDAVLWQKAP